MNPTQLSPLPPNPFTHPTFWGRQHELRTIYKYLLAQPPQSCAIVGETSFGKTTLLRYLSDPQDRFVLDDTDIRDIFTFVYLDCISYSELAEMKAYASAKFWWDLYSGLWHKIHPAEEQPPLHQPRKAEVSIDDVLEIKLTLEELIRAQKRTVVFVLDNFEGVAHLPRSDSEWLRSMVRFHCAYVVASRHLLYLVYQYHQESWNTPSPLWNLFADPIYLGLIPEQEVQDFLLQSSEQAKKLESNWDQRDIAFIRKFAGRHPKLIRIACKQLFEQRLESSQFAQTEQGEFLKISLYDAAKPICSQLWHGLADPELWNLPNDMRMPREKETKVLSPYQKALIRLANGEDLIDKSVLFVLEQRGLIEWADGKWCIFAEVMRRFVLEQEQVPKSLDLTVSDLTTTPHDVESPTFAYLEGKVYDYLKAHVGDVCDREKIKRAVWEDSPPTNSALQKIIERIREKIEPDPNNPRYLIAVRGQGFMLRE